MDAIKIRGARTHNLKNIALDIPRDKLTVITGLSGSGKSSLAFDTLYAEGQRRYVESLSAYARQFLQLMEKPDVDLIEGLSPAISIEQKATSHNPRSTVGTVTEIHDYLRLLYARAGTPHCPDHPEHALEAQSVSQMVDAVLALPEDTRLMIVAPVVSGRKGEQADLFAELRAQGFVRVRVDGVVHELDNMPVLDKNRRHVIEVVVDRFKVRQDLRGASPNPSRPPSPTPRAAPSPSRWTAAPSTSSRPSSPARCAASRWPSSNRGCSRSTTRWAPAPSATAWAMSISSTPSASSPTPICRWPPAPSAAGTAATSSTSSSSPASPTTTSSTSRRPSRSCRKIRHIVLHGSGRDKIAFRYLSDGGRQVLKEHTFEGIIPNLERRYRETDSVACARSSPNTAPTAPARPATAPACAPRRASC
jgi:excinuclease ABC subunit A